MTQPLIFISKWVTAYCNENNGTWKPQNRFLLHSTANGSLVKKLYLSEASGAYWIYTTIDICHDDVIKWKHFLRYWPFMRGIHRSPMKSPHKGQWRGALMFSLICVCINGWLNNRVAGDLRRNLAHSDITVMVSNTMYWSYSSNQWEVIWQICPLYGRNRYK